MSEITKQSKIDQVSKMDFNIVHDLMRDCLTTFNLLVDSESDYKTLRNTITFEAEQQLVARFLTHLQEIKLGKYNGGE